LNDFTAYELPKEAFMRGVTTQTLDVAIYERFDIMSHNFVIGDIVGIGNGKVEYTVTALNEDGTLELQGAKSKRKGVEGDKVRMIEAYNALVSPDAANDLEPNTPIYIADWEIELLQVDDKRYSLVLDGKVTGHKSFDDATFHMSRRDKSVIAAVIYDHVIGRRVVERIA
jgi:hypothetical protein